MKNQLSKNIAFTYFSGTATPLQKRLIEDWIREGKNQEQFYQWLEEWETEFPQVMPDTDQALNRYLLRIEQAGNSTQVEESTNDLSADSFEDSLEEHNNFWATRWWAVAAAVLVCLTTTWLAKDVFMYRTYETAYGEINTIQLEDGSKVTLNAHSVLKMSRFGFGDSVRQVYLKGEAEFSVKHTLNHKRFLVTTPDGLEVEVLGTEFDVNTRAKGTKVVLHKGKVRLRLLSTVGDKTRAEAKFTDMRPGDVILVDKKGKVKVKTGQLTAPYAAWKEHRFVFDNTSLQDIADQIHDTFGWQVSIPDSALASRTIAGSFKAHNPDELLQVLMQLLDIQVEKNGGTVVISNL